MLVLTRKMGETLVVGHEVMITIVGIKAGQVRIGIEAPKEIAIHRKELLSNQNVADQKMERLEELATKQKSRLFKKS